MDSDDYYPYRRLTSEEGHGSISLCGDKPPEGVHVYKKRWYVLVVFCLLGVEQSLLWNTWGPIMDSEYQVFLWSPSSVGMFTNAGNAAYCLSVFPVSWVLDVLGLRMASLASAGLMLIGAAVRCITYQPTSLYWLSMTTSLLTGVASTVTNAGPALFSSIWFPANQRATSTALITLANYGGMAASFIIGPLLVNTQANSTIGNLSDTSPNVNDANNASVAMSIEKEEIMMLLYIECGIAVAIFLLFLAYFPAQPKLPPSVSASKERLNFRKGIRELTTNSKFWLVALAYSVPMGTFGVWGPVLNATLEPMGVSQTDAGWIGFYSTLAGAVAGLFVSRFSDIFNRHMKMSLVGMYVLAAGSMVWAVLLCQGYITFSLAQLYASVILVGILVYGTIPLFFEFTCELCYPVAEGIIGGYLTFLSNLAGVIFLCMLFIQSIGTAWMVWAVLGSILISIPLLLVLQESYSRLQLDIIPNEPEPLESNTPALCVQ